MLFRCQNEALVPLPRYAGDFSRQFEDGRVYRMERIEPRSPQSHSHFFAVLNEAWQTLPEHLAERFPSPEHLRKYALVKAGFCDVRTHVTGTKAEAQRLAAFMRPMDEFAIVAANEAVVSVYTAQSQAVKAMGRKEFERSKQEVFRVIAEMTGTDPSDYGRAA